MPDHAVAPHDGRLIGRRVNDAVVLDARSFADLDVAVISPEHCPRPDRRVRTDSNVTNHHGVGVNEGSCVDTGAAFAQCINRHGRQGNWSAPSTPHRITHHPSSRFTRKGDLQGLQIPWGPVSRRIDIELTSVLPDGGFTWRAAGAKAPKGTIAAGVLQSTHRVGEVLKVEAEFDLNGITVLGLVQNRDKKQKSNTLEMLPSTSNFEPVTQRLAKKSEKPRGPRKDSGPKKARFAAPPELPKRPTPKRLRPGRQHRTLILETLPAEQRPVAEKALSGGIKAVRDAVKSQNEQLKKEGKPEVPAEGLISMAQDLLPKLRVADWLDRAEAAREILDQLDLRDLRSVVVASEDPMVVRDESTRELATALKAALKKRQEEEQTLWLKDIEANLGVGRSVRALKLSSEPPKAGQPFPAELGTKLLNAARESLTSENTVDRWIAVLEAAAFSPIRAQVTVQSIPAAQSEQLLATVKRLAPVLPQVASAFGIAVEPGASAPRPLRAQRPVRKPRNPVKASGPRVKPEVAPS